MGDVGDQLLQVSPFLCDAVFIFLHDFVQPPQPIVDFIEQAFFFNRLLGLHIPGEHIIHLTTKGIGEPDQLPTNQRHKADDAAKRYGMKDNYVAGANIAGFEKVVDAMKAQGIV